MLRTNVRKVHFLLEVEFRWVFFDGVFLFVFLITDVLALVL